MMDRLRRDREPDGATTVEREPRFHREDRGITADTMAAARRRQRGLPMDQSPSGVSAVARWIPALGWLRRYDRRWLRTDVVAGVTLAAYMLPAGLGDASLANLPPEAGLYACLFGGLVFWLFCSSRQTVVTVTSAISLLIGASLGEISGGDPSRFGALAAGTALLMALIAFLA